MENGIIYARFSSQSQNEQSIEAQIRICSEFAENKGIKIVNTYSDKAKSGTNDHRPAFQKMVSDAQTGVFRYIIVYMFDRFARNRRDSVMYKEMLKEKFGIKVISALEPIADDEGGEFYEMFLEWNAEKYSKRLSKRIKDGIDTSIANGMFCGGKVPFGYRLEIEQTPGNAKPVKKVVVYEEEAEIIRFIFEQYADGKTKKQIADMLNKKGCRFNGKLFKGRSFDNWMTNEKYTGEFKFGGRDCKNIYPAIVDKALFLKVQEKLAENKFVLGGQETAKVPYLLSGKVFCGHCGSEMVADKGTGKSGKKHSYYTCKKKRKNECNKRRENKDNLEMYVTSCVVDFLSDKKNAQAAVDAVFTYYEKRTEENGIKAISAKIANIQAEAEKLTDAFINAKTKLLKDKIETKMAEYEILLDNLETQKVQLELERGYRISKKDLLDFIDELLKGDVNDKDYQKQIIDHLVSKVFVSDDNTVVYFNIRGGKNIEQITLNDTKEAIENNIKSVRTLTLPLRQKEIIRTPKQNRGSYYSFLTIISV